MVMIIVYCREYIILSCGVGGGRVDGGRVGGGDNGIGGRIVGGGGVGGGVGGGGSGSIAVAGGCDCYLL